LRNNGMPWTVLRAAADDEAVSLCSRRTRTIPNLEEQAMDEQVSPSEYLVISRGQWDKDIARQEIQNAIDQFYVWLGRLVDEGKMKTGQRLANAGKTG